MTPSVLKLVRHMVATKLISANVSIGTASVFVLVSAGLSFVVDRPAQSHAFGDDWILRGALASTSVPAPVASTHAATPRVQHLG